ncbi:hypothetical protein NDU88_004851 [Pleurodeles waltl]|uniref:Uncharacterized protein n=1 Tax=Pleurodeles waltl TaxID=8319 RepID=A0AAV7V6A5_PLEWA|nr:hypothetical protein NDU88_004851 [Pleurodeles waltl]
MGDCSTTQPKRMGGCTSHPPADRVPKDEEPLPDQTDQAAAQAQDRQVRLEGRDSVVRFLRRTATGSPEWGRAHARPHATEEGADSQTTIEEQTPAARTLPIAQQHEHEADLMMAPRCGEGKVSHASPRSLPQAQLQDQTVAPITLTPRDHDAGETIGSA